MDTNKFDSLFSNGDKHKLKRELKENKENKENKDVKQVENKEERIKNSKDKISESPIRSINSKLDSIVNSSAKKHS